MRLYPERLTEAEEHLHASLEAFRSGGLHSQIARTRIFWGESYAAAGERSLAEYHLRSAAEMLNTLGCELALAEVRHLLDTL